MSLFERINNKIKNDLIIEMNNTGSDDPWDDKDTKKDNKTENKKKPNQNKKFNNKKEKIESGTYNYSKEKKIKNEIGQRRTAQDRQQQLFSRQYDAYDDGDLGNPNQSKTQTTTKTTTQKTPPRNRAPRKGVDYFFDAKKAKKEREAFQQGRKAYTDSKSGIKAGKVTDKGVIDYITKARNMKQGTNANTKANREAAKIIAKSSGSEYKEKIRTKYETDKDLPRKRPSNAKSLEQIKKEIDSRPPDGRTTRTKVKTPSVKRIETKVTDKEIQDLIKQGRQTKPTKTKKITVGAISKRDKAIKDIDDLIIEPKKGEAAATEKGFKKQKRFYQQQQQQHPQSGPRTRTRTRTRTPPGDKSYKDLKKEIENIKKNLKNPVDKSFGDVLKKNQTGFVQPKIKPITKTITPLKAITKTKPASRFGRVMKALRKNPKTAAAALAIGTGVYLYNKGKNKPKSIPPVIGGGNKIKSATTTDINFTLGGKGAGRTSKGAN